MRRTTSKALTVSVIGTVTVALCFQAWMLVEGKNRALDLMAVRAANRAQATAHGVHGVIHQVDLVLQSIRDDLDPLEVLNGPNVDTARKEATLRNLLRLYVSRVPPAARCHVINATGRFVYSSADGVPPITLTDRPYFLEHKAAQTDELRVSQVNFGRSSKRWGIYVTRRIATAEGQFAGIVFCVLEAETLSKEMMAVDQAQWILSLYDRKLQLVASNPAQNESIGKPFADAVLVRGMRDGRSGFRGLALGRTEPHLWATQKVEGLPLLTVAGYSERRALTQWRKDLRINLAVGGVLVLGCLVVLRQLRRAEQGAQALQTANERMRLAATSVQLGVWEWEVQTDNVTWDAEMRTLYELAPGVVVASKDSWLSRVLPEDRERFRNALTSASTASFEERIRIRTDAGQLRHLRVAGVARSDRDGRLLRIVGINWDVTHLERAQHELRASEEYFRTLFDAVPDAVAVVEAGKVVDSNRSYREVLDVSNEERTPPWLLAPVQQPSGAVSAEAGARLYERARAGQLTSAFWTCSRGNGSQFEAEITAKLFRHEGRDLVVTTVRDLSEQRALEEKLNQAQKLDALGQLAGGVAHDFNNMLTAILASAEMLSGDEPEDVQRELRATIVSAAERAAQLTSKLLAFARKGKIRSVPTDVHKIIRETIAMLERTVDRRICISAALRAEKAMVLGDPSQLQSALLNLGVNGRDAMPEGGALVFVSSVQSLAGDDCRVGAFRVAEGDYLCVTVTDTGVGISEENLKHVFDPFFTTKEVGKGTGLGLAAVFGTMASHKGAVTVESKLGEGTRFSLYLPLSIETASENATAIGPWRKGCGTILVVDDEALVRVATTMQVEAMGYVVFAEATPERAIETFNTHHAKISAVLLDMVMPRMAGLDVAARMREIDPVVPIILVSGFTRTDQLDRLLGRSIAGFLQKPFSSVELRRVLAEVCVVRDGAGERAPQGNSS